MTHLKRFWPLVTSARAGFAGALVRENL